MATKSLSERWAEEVLTDNTKLKKCEQCKKCVFRDNDDVWSNRYDKSSCAIYVYPEHKPSKVVDGTEECEFFEEEE